MTLKCLVRVRLFCIRAVAPFMPGTTVFANPGEQYVFV